MRLRNDTNDLGKRLRSLYSSFFLSLFRFFGVTRSNSVCFFVFRFFLSVFIVLRRLGIRFSGLPFVLDDVFLLLFITVLPGSVDRTVVRFL